MRFLAATFALCLAVGALASPTPVDDLVRRTPDRNPDSPCDVCIGDSCDSIFAFNGKMKRGLEKRGGGGSRSRGNDYLTRKFDSCVNRRCKAICDADPTSLAFADVENEDEVEDVGFTG